MAGIGPASGSSRGETRAGRAVFQDCSGRTGWPRLPGDPFQLFAKENSSARGRRRPERLCARMPQDRLLGTGQWFSAGKIGGCLRSRHGRKEDLPARKIRTLEQGEVYNLSQKLKRRATLADFVRVLALAGNGDCERQCSICPSDLVFGGLGCDPSSYFLDH